MPELTIRQIEGEEMRDIVYLLDNYAFSPTPPFPNREEWDARMQTRKGPLYYALFEDQTAVAVAVCPMLTQNVRGKLFKMLGYAGISTHPGARRNGYIRQIVRHTLADLRPLDRPVSCLYPFRESFYQRLGYVTFPQVRKAIFQASNLAPLLKQDLGGRVELDLIGDVYDIYRDFVLAIRPGVHGMAVFDD